MRPSVLVAAPLVAAAYGQRSHVVVSEISGTVTVRSTYTFSNPVTSLLTQTNSQGVITGTLSVHSNTGVAVTSQPAVVTTQPLAATSQPPVATIPAGLQSGDHTLYQNISSTLASFVVSVGNNATTVVNGGGAIPTDASFTTGSSGAVTSAANTGGAGSGRGGRGGGNGGSGNSNSGASSSSSSSSGMAAPTGLKMASAGMIGLGALVAAVL